MVLMRQHRFRGPLEGVGPENRDFLGPKALASVDQLTEVGRDWVLGWVFLRMCKSEGTV